MLDLRYLDNHSEEAIERLNHRKHFDASDPIQRLLKVNQKRRELQKSSDKLAETLHKKAKEVGRCLAQKDERAAIGLKEEIATLKASHKDLLHELKEHEKEVREMLLAIPNIPAAAVPKGEGEADNETVHTWGSIGDYAAATHPHWELLEKYQLASFSLGAKITGSGFPVYQGQGAQLQRALISFFLDEALQHGYQEVLPPLLVNEASAQGTGQLPDKEGLMYALQDSPLYLIPTAEVPVTNLYGQSILASEELPIKHVAYSACFRREAGSWGAHVRGLNRLHQFDKVELVEIHHPSHSKAALEQMRLYAQGLLEKLGLPYRTLLLCTSDLGHSAAMTYDLEVWSAAQKKWLEVSSISLFNDYQARRMNLRYREEGKNRFCHTLNGSALALPRILAALLENYQEEDRIQIPAVLHPYTKFTHITPS